MDGKTFAYRSDACMVFDGAGGQMRSKNYKSLTGKCSSKECEKIWRSFDRSLNMPQFSICRKVNTLQKTLKPNRPPKRPKP